VTLLAKARTSPEGEKPTECTQPPDGLEYSPHTVLNGSFSPHTEGGGLAKNGLRKRKGCTRREEPLLLVDVFDVGRKDAGFHVRASCGEQHIVWMPVDREDGGADRLLELLCDPPVVVRIKRTDRDSPLDQGRLKHMYTILNKRNGALTSRHLPQRIYPQTGSSGQMWPHG
jgi:hypothetical protein